MRIKTPVLDESRVIRHLHLRLWIWYLLVFVVFELTLATLTYGAMRYRLTQAAYDQIRAEWAQKNTDVTTLLNLSREELDHYVREPETEHVRTDTTPEPIATSVVAANGSLLREDAALVDAPGSLIGPIKAMKEMAPDPKNPDTWRTIKVGGVPVLAGRHNFFHQGRYQGAMISFLSLEPAMETSKELAAIEVELALGSLLLVMPFSYWLSRKAMSPFRMALSHQRHFINDAAHELRTPLTILRGTLDLARTDSDPEELQQSLNDALSETDYLSRLVEDLSILARLESEAPELVTRPLDLVKTAKDTVSRMTALADRQNVTLRYQGQDHPVWIVGDPERLRQLLTILIDNAIKYNRPQGSVLVRVAVQGDAAAVFVQDTGIGISRADQRRIFDRFYRGANAAQSGSGGSGIGLAIALRIATLHQGRISVSSEPGQGTTFTVTFPLAKGDFARDQGAGTRS